jgi:hypothetical protein
MEKEDHELIELEALHQIQSHNESRMDRDVNVFIGQAQQRRQTSSNKAVFTAQNTSKPSVTSQSSNQHTIVTVYQTKQKKSS